VAGAKLRARQDVFALPNDSAVQASALLKLTPEQPAVKIESLGEPKGDAQYRDLLNSVLKLVQANFVEKITSEQETKMARGAVQGMLDVMGDPDTRFVDPKETQLLDDAALGRFHGLGAILALRREKLEGDEIQKIVVVAPMPGSPAEKAGLMSGDLITDVGGKWVIAYDPGFNKLNKAMQNQNIDRLTYKKAWEAAQEKMKNGMSISDALDELTTKTSGDTTLKVERPGRKDPFDVKVQYHDTIVDPVTSRMLDRKIGYIRVAQFNQQASKEFKSELGKIRNAGAKALILDLRNSPGGLLDTATNVTAQFTGGGTLAIIREQSGRHTIRVPKTRALPLPVAVLVNRGTASVAELVAATLRESGIGTLVGVTTFGDGLVQTPLVLKDGSAALITTGKMLTPKGLDFTGTGLKPDKEVVSGEGGTDVQLAEAQKLLQAKIGRI
jgi:carboxyl-terminal processing protease